jgi:hypothetical protein
MVRCSRRQYRRGDVQGDAFVWRLGLVSPPGTSNLYARCVGKCSLRIRGHDLLMTVSGDRIRDPENQSLIFEAYAFSSVSIPARRLLR